MAACAVWPARGGDVAKVVCDECTQPIVVDANSDLGGRSECGSCVIDVALTPEEIDEVDQPVPE